MATTSGTFRRKARKNSGMTPETLSERFLEFPLRVRLGSPKPCNSRHLRLPEYFQQSLPPVWLGMPLFFKKMVLERASQSCRHGIPSSTEGISETQLAVNKKSRRFQIASRLLQTPKNPIFLGFPVLTGGLRPWFQTMVAEGARPWGRGRSGDCEINRKLTEANRQ